MQPDVDPRLQGSGDARPRRAFSGSGDPRAGRLSGGEGAVSFARLRRGPAGIRRKASPAMDRPLSPETPGAQAAQSTLRPMPVTKKAEQPSTRRAAGIVGIAVIASRLFGLVREQVFAAMFGAGKLLDVYLASFQIPNLLRDLFAEGALSISFTTLFTTSWDTEGEASAWDLASLILTSMVFLMGLV